LTLVTDPILTIINKILKVYFSHFLFDRLPARDGRCVQNPDTHSPQRADLRLLTIPSSCSRVPENN